MNRYKAEEARKRREARMGLTEEDIAAIDRTDALTAKIVDLARAIHIEWFPEEYDHMLDSIVDAKERARGINPMSTKYIEKVNTRRAERGVAPLSPSGMPMSDDTWKIAYAEAEARLQNAFE